ncbi:hypothetical protein HBH78_054750 [Parastagonospora nodorum]|nr:hypothetical protein HBH67_122640 [Parastagonospora nodorum]KAH4706571.1 hypothetical protein HBH78_054750 [Parastagonospora nodorum]KAH4788329.1 hypothetical protein HBH62_054430 [Parastagonospora nodorum]KAH4835173.1 hypothetical protein HBH63_017330 [Parastagonospora nodorum]
MLRENINLEQHCRDPTRYQIAHVLIQEHMMQSLRPVLQQAALYTFLGWSFLLSQASQWCRKFEDTGYGMDPHQELSIGYTLPSHNPQIMCLGSLSLTSNVASRRSRSSKLM